MRIRLFTLIVLGALSLIPAPNALASHQFTDVPDTHPFHVEIGIFKDTNITSGCTTTTFCPSDYVRRQAIAAWIDRALGLVVRPGETTQKGVPGSRVALLDDDLSFVGTAGNALGYRGPSNNVVGGSASNYVNAGVVSATIAGGGEAAGYANVVRDDNGTVGGGRSNWAGDGSTTSDGTGATVAGGTSNGASGSYSSITGGTSNGASGSYSSIAGGYNNGASGDYANVAGGGTNSANGWAATVAGGYGNLASGVYSAVAGGAQNEAFGTGSFAAGRNAHASTGSFHFGDGNWSGGAATYSPNEYSFSAHATGGVHFHTNASGATTGCWIFPGGGSWSCSSDRDVKENFRPVDGRRLLAKVAKLPISSWNYKGQKDRFRHIGPMSQDFKAAFSVGEDDKSIAMVDADGVSLAAIQALYRENLAMKSRLAQLERSLATLMRKDDE